MALFCVQYSNVDWIKVTQYDDKCFHLANVTYAHLRHQFLSEWCAIDGSTALVAVHEGKVVGLGCIRPCQKVCEYQLGPLYADNEGVAEAIMFHLCKDLTEKDIVTTYVW